MVLYECKSNRLRTLPHSARFSAMMQIHQRKHCFKEESVMRKELPNTAELVRAFHFEGGEINAANIREALHDENEF